MNLLALCYPKLRAEDQRFIDAFRHAHDHAYRDVVRPHFTMVYQVRDLAESVFTEHVARIAGSSTPISFACRYAMVHNDVSSDDHYVFLVPDEGFSEISRLHDALYTDILGPKLRLDVPYVPHIGIATLKEPHRCKDLADELNGRGLSLDGRLDEVSVVEYNGKTVTDLRHFRLGSDAA